MRTVVHDGGLRMNGRDQSLRVRLVRSMVRYQKQVHFADQVIRTRELELLVFRQVTQVEKTEFAVGDQHTQGAGILRRVCRRLRFARASWIRLPCSRQM